MLRYYSLYQYDNGPYEEEGENDSSEVEESLDEDNEWDDDNDDRVCLCDPTDTERGICCCSILGIECNGKCHADGYERWLEAQQVTL